MKIAIIGAGPSGLCAARHCLEQNYSFDVFEQNSDLGGLWIYTDHTTLDDYGLEVHSSMYQNLSTNVPKELMQYEDFPYPLMTKSYIGYREVLAYVQSYAEKFKIKSHIKFFSQVTKVDPDHSKWLIEVRDVRSGVKESYAYDAVVVCSGHQKVGDIPEIPGLDTFQGKYMHSHVYRRADYYRNKKVLIVGLGPSGIDICRHLVGVADKIYLSYKASSNTSNIPSQAVPKPLIRELKGYQAIFEDGSAETIDEILFCTGYLYSFPFLSERCQIDVTDNYVHPLYKHIININHPTMAFVGLLNFVCCFPEFDLQSRFFLATLSGQYPLPSRDQMLQDYRAELDSKTDKPLKDFHALGLKQEEYFNDLADVARIKRVPPVITKLFARVIMNTNHDDCFQLIDEENFIQTC